MGQGKDCCRYIVMGGGGFECAKVDPEMKRVLDRRVMTMVAQGDNCEGVTDLNERE
jgi:hypothetical protein